MLKLITIIVFILYTSIEVAQFASFLPNRATNGRILDYQKPVTSAPRFDNSNNNNEQDSIRTAAQYNSSASPLPTRTPDAQSSTWESGDSAHSDNSGALTSPQTTTTSDPNVDLEDLSPSTPPNGLPETGSVTPAPDSNSDGKVTNNKSKPHLSNVDGTAASFASTELSVLFYSVFVVYVSFIKLIYHNISIIKRNLTEPGILMIFGIIWELVVRQITDNYESSPKFNSRIFFYLFLPSTVLEAASLLSNKWLFLNLLPILIHSILGTLFYASCLGFSIYALNKENIFNMAITVTSTNQRRSSAIYSQWQQSSYHLVEPNQITISEPLPLNRSELIAYNAVDWTQAVSKPRQQQHQSLLLPTTMQFYDTSSASSSPGSSVELSNLTLADCLVFGTILSSVDSTIVLETFRSFQVNEKLYYLVLGENLMNNAVVIVIFDLLLDFFNETRITVVKIYIAITQFFVTLIGSIFIGLLLAGVALVSIRISKRFQSPQLSYSYQCQAMVETLLILKLAYLTYTLASLAGTSSIVSLATFGILQDQYIKHNLNLRSQLTFRQVILAAKTVGYSLVYPLLGMLLVEVTDTSHFFQAWLSFEPTNTSSLPLLPDVGSGGGKNYTSTGATSTMFMAASGAASKLSHLAGQANLHWNFKFLSLVTLITILIRFIVVICLSLLCNPFFSSQLKIKFKEQILVAYGGLKGPLAFALVNRLVEHEEYRDRTMRNKHLFMYTILFITFLSTLIKGSFIRPLVSKMQPVALGSSSLPVSLGANSSTTLANAATTSTIVFDKINCKLTEYVTNGLNSILGHTKSPYDRFVELNETLIKPRLARSDSNTNWLSVFYDNLILDEILNANCFYRSTEIDPALHFHLQHSKTNSNGDISNSTTTRQSVDNIIQKQQWVARGKSTSMNPLETIDEINQSSMKQSVSIRAKEVARLPGSRVARLASGSQRHTSQGPTNLRRFLGENSQDRAPESSVLKEFVMFNLKLEDARSRKRLPVAAAAGVTRVHHSSNKVEPVTASCDEDFVAIQRQKVARMLSTSSSDLGKHLGEGSSSTQMRQNADKQRHIAELERRLAEVDNQVAVEPAHQAPHNLINSEIADRPGASTANLSGSRVGQPQQQVVAATKGQEATTRTTHPATRAAPAATRRPRPTNRARGRRSLASKNYHRP